MRLIVTIKDLKQVGTAASQNRSVSHQFMTTNLDKEKEGKHLDVYKFAKRKPIQNITIC